MPTIMEEISMFCRFCLRREGLMALSEATSASFSIADVVQLSEIEISENEGDTPYAICFECCSTIQNSVCFRRSCQNNDVQFKKFVAVLNEVQTKDKVNKSEIQTIDASIGNDSDSEQSANEAQFEERTEYDALTALPSLYGEVMTGLIRKCSSTNDIVPSVKPTRKIEERYVCEVCGNLYVDIYNHVKRSHRPQKIITCSQCQKTLNTPFDLKRHINVWHEKRIMYTCEHCGKGFTNHRSYFYHIKNSHGKSVYECKICHRKFKSHDGHRKHQKEHSITCYPCLHCSKLFRNTRTLKFHEHRYHAS